MRNIKLTIEYDGKRYLGWQCGHACSRTSGKFQDDPSNEFARDAAVL